MMGGRRLSLTWVGAVPFLGYVAIFLFLPAAIIVAGAFASEGGLTLSNFANLSRPYIVSAIIGSVFLPAVDGIKPQWREATDSLGGSTWTYWRYVAGPLLAPAFLGSMLLLFANALSAYATAAALINQGGPILPLQISNAITSEVGLHEPGFAKAQAVVLILIVAIVSVLYAVLQRRTARWLQ